MGWLPLKEKGRRRRGFWMLLLGVSLRGRVLPWGGWTFSSRTLEQEATSQHRETQQAMERLQGLLQGRPLILDRGFHNRVFFAWLQQRGIPFIVRIRMGGQGLDIRDARGERLQPVVAPGERQVWREVQRHDLQGLTLIGYWASSHTAPIWLLTTWPNPEEALEGYLMRMPIERPFLSGLENPAP